MLAVFDEMIADIESNKNLNPKVTELFLRGRKLSISLVFIQQSYYKEPKNYDYIASNHSSDIAFKDIMEIYKAYTKEPYPFLVNDTTLSSDNPLRFTKNLL